MSVIFVKTPKGVGEIEQRSGGLTPRTRRVLIMLDGKRTDDDIRAMALADDLDQTLKMLVDAGYIEPLKGPEPAAPATAADHLPRNPWRTQSERNGDGQAFHHEYAEDVLRPIDAPLDL